MIPCRKCGEPIQLIMRAAAATADLSEIWFHIERQPWHGDYYDHSAHNAEPVR